MKKPRVVTLKSKSSGNNNLKTLYDVLEAQEKHLVNQNKNNPASKIYEEIKYESETTSVVWIDDDKLNKILKIIKDKHPEMRNKTVWKDMVSMLLTIAKVHKVGTEEKELNNLEDCLRVVAGDITEHDMDELKLSYTFKVLFNQLELLKSGDSDG